MFITWDVTAMNYVTELANGVRKQESIPADKLPQGMIGHVARVYQRGKATLAQRENRV